MWLHAQRVSVTELVQIAPEVYTDPLGAVVLYKGVTYYRDGFLVGYPLDSSAPVEQPMPTLWSSLVIEYRKKPVVIQAIQLGKANAEEIAEWCGGQVVEEINPHDETERFVGINIPTLEGVMRASEGDYVIKGVKGEFYPCKPHIFAETYELH